MLASVNSWQFTREEFSKHWYPGSAQLVSEAADVIGLEGKRVLVVGTQNPWVEAILLSKRAAEVLMLVQSLIFTYKSHIRW